VHCGASIHPTIVKEIQSAIPSLLNASDQQNAQDGDDDVVANAEDEIKICRNTALRYSTSKKVSIARSGIHGWGAFIMEPAEKNEFIMEYVGEIVSQVRLFGYYFAVALFLSCHVAHSLICAVLMFFFRTVP
jgi:hypothetical protein